MESENRQRSQTALYEEEVLVRRTGFANSQGYNGMKQESLNHCKDQIQDSQALKILTQIHDKQLLVVNRHRRNGLILYKRYHAEFAGPGAAVGGLFDLDCQQVLPVGNLELIHPQSADDRQQAYKIRLGWIRLIKQITGKSVSIERAQTILNQFEHYFDAETITGVPDEAFALLVGVLPHTVRQVRNTVDRVDM